MTFFSNILFWNICSKLYYSVTLSLNSYYVFSVYYVKSSNTAILARLICAKWTFDNISTSKS